VAPFVVVDFWKTADCVNFFGAHRLFVDHLAALRADVRGNGRVGAYLNRVVRCHPAAVKELQADARRLHESVKAPRVAVFNLHRSQNVGVALHLAVTR
jgi:hypothetical protein